MHSRAKGTADYYWPLAVFFKMMIITVRDGILSVADYNSTRVGVVVVVVVVVVVYFFTMG